jgi:hypothetical protein
MPGGGGIRHDLHSLEYLLLTDGGLIPATGGRTFGVPSAFRLGGSAVL